MPKQKNWQPAFEIRESKDAPIEAADVVLMEDVLFKLINAVTITRRTGRIVVLVISSDIDKKYCGIESIIYNI